uniref:Uncharacterized protein n=1 Tax=Romanomermis culicivorax TaxID=13658 RepID=A0A915KSZ9_ROMCU
MFKIPKLSAYQGQCSTRIPLLELRSTQPHILAYKIVALGIGQSQQQKRQHHNGRRGGDRQKKNQRHQISWFKQAVAHQIAELMQSNQQLPKFVLGQWNENKHF